MYTSPEAVYQELKLESKHVLALFHHIWKEQALSLKWFSTQTIVELINRVFSLHSQSIALEYKQFVDVLKRDIVIRTMAVENACDCVSENFLRTMLQDDMGRREPYYCFPPQGRKKRSGGNMRAKKRLRSSMNTTESFEMPPVPFPCKIDDDGKKFLQRCNLQFNLYSIIGHVARPVIVTTASPVAACTTKPTSSPDAVTPARTSLFPPESSSSFSSTLPSHRILVTPSTATPIQFHPQFAIKDIWDSLTSKNLFNFTNSTVQ